MLFNSGNPSLVGLTEMLGGQSSSSVGLMFPLQEVKDQINLAYQELWWDAKAVNAEWGVKRDSTFDSVIDQVDYDMDTTPGDVDGKILQVAVELTGKDLTSDSTAAWTYLEPSTSSVAERGWREGTFTTTRFYTYERLNGEENIKIFAPLTVTGTNNIFIQYEQELTFLSGDTDEPIISPSFHPAIAYLAAAELRKSRDFPYQDIQLKAEQYRQKWKTHVQTPMMDLDGQIVSRGRISRTFATKTGFFTRPA